MALDELYIWCKIIRMSTKVKERKEFSTTCLPITCLKIHNGNLSITLIVKGVDNRKLWIKF